MFEHQDFGFSEDLWRTKISIHESNQDIIESVKLAKKKSHVLRLKKG